MHERFTHLFVEYKDLLKWVKLAYSAEHLIQYIMAIW
jgi:hypothetical protein